MTDDPLPPQPQVDPRRESAPTISQAEADAGLRAIAAAAEIAWQHLHAHRQSQSGRPPALFTPWLCYRCGYAAADAGAIDGGERTVAVEGDLAICLSCGTWHVLHGPGWLQLTADERDRLPDRARRDLTVVELVRRATAREALAKRNRP